METQKDTQIVPEDGLKDRQKASSFSGENCQPKRNPDFFKIFFLVIIGLMILLSVFKLGIVVGEKKADFTRQWSDNYHMNFAGPKEGFFKNLGDKDLIEASGTFGQIIKMDGSTIVVKGQNDVEKTVIAGEGIQIKRFNEDVGITDLKVDDRVVIIGEPNESGQIEAKFIRIMPPPPEGGSFNGGRREKADPAS
ncbi:MAG: hypothetical protein WC926_03985 [Candidatus Paceibacterota bacterium]|jgi:hypothetical protein